MTTAKNSAPSTPIRMPRLMFPLTSPAMYAAGDRGLLQRCGCDAGVFRQVGLEAGPVHEQQAGNPHDDPRQQPDRSEARDDAVEPSGRLDHYEQDERDHHEGADHPWPLADGPARGEPAVRALEEARPGADPDDLAADLRVAQHDRYLERDDRERGEDQREGLHPREERPGHGNQPAGEDVVTA